MGAMCGQSVEPVRLTIHERVTPDDLRKWIRGMEFAQDEREFNALLREIRGIGSLLEVGSRFGESLWRFSQAMRPKSRLVSIDLPGCDGSMLFLDSEKPLLQRAEQIRNEGHQVAVIIGDSHAKEVVEKAQEFGPYDFIFIDGDHSKEGEFGS